MKLEKAMKDLIRNMKSDPNWHIVEIAPGGYRVEVKPGSNHIVWINGSEHSVAISEDCFIWTQHVHFEDRNVHYGSLEDITIEERA